MHNARLTSIIELAAGKVTHLFLFYPKMPIYKQYTVSSESSIDDAVIEIEIRRNRKSSTLFWENLSMPNFLTFLYIKLGRIYDAMRLNDEVLARDGGNLNALACRAILEECEDDDDLIEDSSLEHTGRLGEDVLPKALTSEEFEIQTWIAKAEIAQCFEFSESKDMFESIFNLYSDVLSQYGLRKEIVRFRNCIGSVHDEIGRWKHGKLQCYMKAVGDLLRRHNKAFSLSREVFQMLQELWLLFDDLSKSELPSKWKARSLIMLAEFCHEFKNWDNIFPRELQNVNIIRSCKEAIELCSRDEVVIEKYVELMVTCATEEVDLLEIMRVLSDCIELQPESAGESFRRMGLTYRNLWLLKEEEQIGNDYLRSKSYKLLDAKCVDDAKQTENNQNCSCNNSSCLEYINKAYVELNKACKFDDKNVAYLVVIARTLFSLGKKEEAENAFENAIALTEDYWETTSSIWQHFGVWNGCENKSGVLKETLWILEQLENNDDMRIVARAVVDKVNLCQKYGNALRMSTDLNVDVLKMCRKAAEWCNESDGYVYDVLEQCGEAMRKEALRKKDLEDAIAVLKLALDVNSNQDIAHFQLGLAYKDIWLREVEQNPAYCLSTSRYPNSRIRRADTTIVEGHRRHRLSFEYLVKSNECFSNACSLDPTNFKYFILQASNYFSLGMEVEALVNLDNAIVAACKEGDVVSSFWGASKRYLYHAEILKEIAWILDKLATGNNDRLLRARALVDAADLRQQVSYQNATTALPPSLYKVNVRQNCRKAAEMCEDDLYVIEKCGRIIRRTARNKYEMDDAINMLNTAVRLAPEKDFAFYQLGLAYRVLWLNELDQSHHSFSSLNGRTDNPRCGSGSPGFESLVKANSNFLKVCQLRPNHCRCLVDLARTCISLGDVDKAGKFFEKAMRLPVGDTLDHYNKSLKGYCQQQWSSFKTIKLP